jgi:MatE
VPNRSRLSRSYVCVFFVPILHQKSYLLGPAGSESVTSSSLTYQLPYALSVAAAVRVGNLVGAQHIGIARVSALVAVSMSVGVGFFNSLLLVLNKGHWGELFSGEKEVVDIVASIVSQSPLFHSISRACFPEAEAR